MSEVMIYLPSRYLFRIDEHLRMMDTAIQEEEWKREGWRGNRVERRGMVCKI